MGNCYTLYQKMKRATEKKGLPWWVWLFIILFPIPFGVVHWWVTLIFFSIFVALAWAISEYYKDRERQILLRCRPVPALALQFSGWPRRTDLRFAADRDRFVGPYWILVWGGDHQHDCGKNDHARSQGAKT